MIDCVVKSGRKLQFQNAYQIPAKMGRSREGNNFRDSSGPEPDDAQCQQSDERVIDIGEINKQCAGSYETSFFKVLAADLP